MSFIRREIYTKNKDIQRYLDKLITDSVVSLPPHYAQDIGKSKAVRQIRNLNPKDPFIFIGHDRKYNISVIKIREPVKIIKKGDRYEFSL